MKALTWLLAVTLSLVTPVFGQEACQQDDEGLVNQLDDNLVFGNARTAEDFMHESLRHFFTNGFHGWRDFTLLTSNLTAREWLQFFVFVSSRFEYAYAMCNDIGQCAQGELTSYFSRMPNDAATDATNSVLDWISGGELSVSRIFAPGLVRHDFMVKTGDGDTDTAEVFEWTPKYIMTNLDEYPVRDDQDPLVTDKRCRNNFGELLEGQPDQPLGGGGSLSSDSPTSEGYWTRVHSGWNCYPDATGVVCFKTYAFRWLEW